MRFHLSSVTKFSASAQTSNILLRWPFRHQSTLQASGFVTIDVEYLWTGHESFNPRPIK